MQKAFQRHGVTWRSAQRCRLVVRRVTVFGSKRSDRCLVEQFENPLLIHVQPVGCCEPARSFLRMEQVIYRDACYADTQVCYGDPQERLFSGEIKEFKGRTSKAARGRFETSTRQIKPPHVPSQLFNETLLTSDGICRVHITKQTPFYYLLPCQT